MIEQTIHTRLSGLGGSVNGVYPADAPTNAQPPFVVYTADSVEQSIYFDGPSSLSKYSIVVDVWSATATDTLALMGAVCDLLNGWRSGSVKRCTRTGYSTDPQERGFHGQLTFSVWASD